MVLRIIYSAVNPRSDRPHRRFSEGEHDGHARGPVVVALQMERGAEMAAAGTGYRCEPQLRSARAPRPSLVVGVDLVLYVPRCCRS